MKKSTTIKYNKADEILNEIVGSVDSISIEENSISNDNAADEAERIRQE